MQNMIKLNLGCGTQKYKGYVNIDFDRTVDPDMVLDISEVLPYEENSVDEIFLNHSFEHLPKGKLWALMRHWYSILKPGGMIKIELPDFDGLITRYLEVANHEDADKWLEWIFGSQDKMGQTHLWGWNKPRLWTLLSMNGFTDINFVNPIDGYHSQKAPCLRVEAKKT